MCGTCGKVQNNSAPATVNQRIGTPKSISKCDGKVSVTYKGTHKYVTTQIGNSYGFLNDGDRICIMPDDQREPYFV